MSNRHIIFVPGKSTKPPENVHGQQLWRVLLEGVRRADKTVADEIEKHREIFSLVAWNYIYYHKSRDISLDLPWIDALIKKNGPTQHDINGAHDWNRKLSRVIHTLADHFPFLIQWLPDPTCQTIHETSRYFKNKRNIGYEIRALLKNKLRPMLEKDESVLIIAHSMGSVIAYDTLWELSHEEHRPGKVDLLCIGSPLGAKFVQRRLLGHKHTGNMRFPTNIRRWTNVSAEGDITALDSCFGDDFSEMLTLNIVDSINDHCNNVYNYYRDKQGLNVHRSYGYLINPVVGKVISDWWQSR